MKMENRICGYHYTSHYHKNLNPVLQKQFPGREADTDYPDHISQEHPNLHNGKIACGAGKEECQKQDCRCFRKKLRDNMAFCNSDRQQNANFMDTAPDTHGEYQEEDNYADNDCRNDQECCQPPDGRKLIRDSVILRRVRLERIVLPLERRASLICSMTASSPAGSVTKKSTRPE